MGKASKASRKFQKKGHLRAAITQRKTVQKINRTRQQQEAGRASKRAQASDDEKKQGGQPGKALENMSIDEFMAGGFLDAQLAGGGAAVSDDNDDEQSDSDAELGSGSSVQHEPHLAPGLPASKKQAKQQQQHVVVAAAMAAGGRNRKEAEEQLAAEASDSETESEGESGSESEDGSDSSSSEEADGEKERSKSGGSKSALKAEIASHKAQLQALKQQDPEFYAYLQSTDLELLNFGKESEDELDSEEEGEGVALEEEQAAEGTGTVADGQQQQLQRSGITFAMVECWCQAAREKAGMGALRNIMKAYRVACHYGDSEEQAEESMRIASSAVYNKVMLFVLREIDGIFRRMLLEGASTKQQQQPLTAAALVKLPRWKKVEPLAKSYLGNTLHLLGALTDAAMQTFILRRLRASTVLLAPYEKLQRRLLKAALGLFGSADNAPRVQAILLVRQMALELPQPALDNCLKGVYRAFSTNAKFVNAASVPQISFMAAAVVEMYGINTAASYQHAFSFIRQLGVLLRSALTNKSKDAYREVYCWQTINCLELWAKLLVAKADEPELRPLVYPITQLLLGVARLVPAPAYFPLRLCCARALNRLGEATNTFIPVAPILLEVLQWSDLRKAPKPGAGQQPDVLLQLRVSKANMRSVQYQEEIINQVMELLSEHLACWGCHIAFPELSFLTLSQLRKFIKNTPVERFRKAAKQLVEAVEKNVAFVGRARDQVDFSPKDLAQVAMFLAKESAAKQAPIQQYAKSLLDRARQRLQMRLADAVELGSGPAATVGDDSDDDEVPAGSLLPKQQQQQQQPALENGPTAKRQKTAAAQKQLQAQDSSEESESDAEGEEMEEVAPYELSDEEDSADRRGGVVQFDGSVDEEDEESGEDKPRAIQQVQRLQQQQQHVGSGSGHVGKSFGGGRRGCGGRRAGTGFGRRNGGGRGGSGRGGRSGSSSGGGRGRGRAGGRGR